MIINAIAYCLDPKISKEISEQLSKLHPTNVLYLHGLRFVSCLCEQRFLGLVTATTLSPGSGAVLLLLWIGSGVPDVFQLGELLVDLTEGNL